METISTELPEPEVLDWSRLPRHLRDNWHVVNRVKSDARESYAVRYAIDKVCDLRGLGLPEPTQSEDWFRVYRKWHDAFGRAACHWSRFNTLEPQWSSRSWPAGAEREPSADEVEQAISIMLGAKPQRTI